MSTIAMFLLHVTNLKAMSVFIHRICPSHLLAAGVTVMIVLSRMPPFEMASIVMATMASKGAILLAPM
jgi:hypothetical protein